MTGTGREGTASAAAALDVTGVTGVADVVDTARYPLDDPGDPAWRGVVERARAELRAGGCTVLRGVIRDDRRADLCDQGRAVAPNAHRDVATVNAYNTAPDPTLPAEHPAHVTFARLNAFVAHDRIPAGHLIHRLYRDVGFQRLLADCFSLGEVHELADPYAGLTLNVVAPGDDHPWHFDTNEIAVSLLTQEPEAGGVFEYCPDIRSVGDENAGAVRAVLDGDHGRVRRLTLRPGDLQLFRGRFALHRVTTVGGGVPRHSAIFAYSTRPGVVNTATRSRQLFGRVAPEHTAAGRRSVDALQD